MTAIVGPLPYTIVNGAAIDATPIMSNYNWLMNQVNANAAPLSSPTFTGTLTVTGSIASTGSYTFSNPGSKLFADLSNATLTNRLLVQSSTSNGDSTLGIIPNGTATTAGYSAYNNADPTNSSVNSLIVTSSESQYVSDKTGTGTYLPMTFYTSGSKALTIDTSGNLIPADNVGIGTASPTAKLHLVGTSIVPTAASSDNSTTIASTAFVNNFVAAKATQRPAFSYYRNTNQSSGSIALFDTAAFMQHGGTNYNTSTGKFTAPITGFYQFNFTVGCYNNTGFAFVYGASLTTNAGKLNYSFLDAWATGTSASFSAGATAYLTAGQTVWVEFITTLGPTLTMWGKPSTEPLSTFSGHFIDNP